MTFPNYHARAELYLGSDRPTAMAQGGRTFATAAQAIRFAFEEAAPVSLHGAMLRIGGATYAGADLTDLYRSPAFPLPRKPSIRRRPHGNRSGALYAASRAAPRHQVAMA
ncbi:hypothetical protein [Devosia sp. Root635]|uniref:hypothetical protein n=1 Tax=Devosia sp. Root635 TaxID=1736575 RepID=UPI0006F339DF|nr:hypothetical protein [Devosia sp. Root635]KRA55810.1 hypothetical protein ASD80_00560 [Devosia sp. Root635]